MRCEVGTDIAAVGRIRALMRDGGAAFLERWFTAREINYCSGKAMPSRHFAAQFAAKEAVVKALPVAWDGPLPWQSIEISNGPCGVPSVCLFGAILDAATKAGVGEIKVSLSLRRIRYRGRPRDRHERSVPNRDHDNRDREA